jgi:hypothetical protein
VNGKVPSQSRPVTQCLEGKETPRQPNVEGKSLPAA